MVRCKDNYFQVANEHFLNVPERIKGALNFLVGKLRRETKLKLYCNLDVFIYKMVIDEQGDTFISY